MFGILLSDWCNLICGKNRMMTCKHVCLLWRFSITGSYYNPTGVILFSICIARREGEGLETIMSLSVLKNSKYVSTISWATMLRTFALKSSQAQILNLPRRKAKIDLWQRGKKNWGSPTSFWREHVPKNTLNLKNRASKLANKATDGL